MCVVGVGNFAHIYTETPILTAIYLGGALLAFASLQPNIPFAWARVLAVASVVAMFFYFAGFFRIVDHFTSSGIEAA